MEEKYWRVFAHVASTQSKSALGHSYGVCAADELEAKALVSKEINAPKGGEVGNAYEMARRDASRLGIVLGRVDRLDT